LLVNVKDSHQREFPIDPDCGGWGTSNEGEAKQAMPMAIAVICAAAALIAVIFSC